MNRDAAQELGVRIVQTWPDMKIPVDIWIDALAPLNDGAAGTVYARFRARLNKAPSVADFLAEYHRLDVRPPTIERDGPYVSFADHLAKIANRAAHGDADAIAEFAMWERIEARRPQPKENL